MRSALSILFLCCGFFPAFGQKLVLSSYSGKSGLTKEIETLTEQKAEMVLEMEKMLKAAQLSGSALVFIQGAIGKVPNQQAPSLKETLDRIAQRRDLSRLNQTGLLSLEQKLLSLNQRQ